MSAFGKLVSDPNTLIALKRLLDIVQVTLDLSRDGPELSKEVLRVGSSLGRNRFHGDVSIVHLDPKKPNEVYVEFESLKPHLFVITPKVAKDWVFGAHLVEIYESTIGTIYLVNLMLTLVAFAPALAEGGFTAVLYEVMVFYTSAKIDEYVSKTNDTAGKILGMLFMMLTKRPKYGPPSIEGEVPGGGRVELYEIEPEESSRSFEEILGAQREEAKLIGDLHNGTLAGKAAQLRDKISDAVLELDLGFSREELERGIDVDPTLAAEAPGTNISLRVPNQPGGRGLNTGGGATAVGFRLETRLQNSKVVKVIDEYLPILEEGDKKLTQKEINAIRQQLRTGKLRYSEAVQEMINVLNTAREMTGEFVADSLVWSNYKVRRIVTIPSRANGVPILDRVYEAEDPNTGQTTFIVAEIKGGKNTGLGSVTRKVYEFKNNKLQITKVSGEVEQASPEWYYQKIIEIYELGGKRNQSLARSLFNAVKSGKVKSMVIKSGRNAGERPKFAGDQFMNPSPKVEGTGLTPSKTDKISSWFSNKQLPYDAPGRHP
jgi:hypothetical protein